ncbi:MAG: hypothetical protein VKQ33_12020 [Candidatus Sericytochromatia bacterium]|nr:hypothetical protein [Candidatus Sericytochromatia bacterium]
MLCAMSGPTALDPDTAQRLAALTRQRYEDARAAGWAPPARAALLRAALDALARFLAEAPADGGARPYVLLVLDLTASCGADELARWPDVDLRAARVAATRVLSGGAGAERRPRAQALLKRLDLVQEPLLQARERLAMGVSQALRDLPLEASDPRHEAFRADVALRATARRLGAMPQPPRDTPHHAHVLEQVEGLLGALSGGNVLAPATRLRLFEGLQRLGAPPGASLPVAQGLEALEALETAVDPDGFALNAVYRLVFRLDLGAARPAERGAVAQLLGQLPAIHRRLAAAGADERDAGLLRLRHQLASPSEPGLEGRLDRLGRWLDGLTARRDAARARLARAEGQPEPPRVVQQARVRLRQLERLRDALLEVEATGLGPAGEAALEQTCLELDRVAAEAFWDAETFEVLLTDLRRRLEAPEATALPAWRRLQRLLLRVEGLRELTPDGPARGLLAKVQFCLRGLSARLTLASAPPAPLLDDVEQALEPFERGDPAPLAQVLPALLQSLGPTPS